MTPVHSTTPHDPDNGLWGDCHSCCLASILDLPRDQVPQFFDARPAKECWASVEEFLAGYDLATVDVPYPGEFSLTEVLTSQKHTNPGVYYVLGVSGPHDTGHSVVCCDDEVVHDPTYSGDVHLYRPAVDGKWWVTYYVPIGLTRRRAATSAPKQTPAPSTLAQARAVLEGLTLNRDETPAEHARWLRRKAYLAPGTRTTRLASADCFNAQADRIEAALRVLAAQDQNGGGRT